MAGRDIIVVGASAGGVEALRGLVRGLPAGLPAAVFVVLHIAPTATSFLPQILSRAGPLPASHAVSGEPIRHGRIYVAPPDRHLLVRAGFVELSHGPRENHSRPAVDPLFRSAAVAYRHRVIGVVLSGALDDGSLGLVIVKAYGGTTVVQHPDEAMVASMPLRALRFGSVDRVLPVADIAPWLVELVNEPEPAREGVAALDIDPEAGEALVQADLTEQAANRRGGQTSVFSCAECGGVLWQIETEGIVQFRCHVGHTYSPEVLLVQKSEALESALWSSVRLLKEKAILARQLATQLRQQGDEQRAGRIDEQAQLDEQHVHLIRQVLLNAWPSLAAQASDVEPPWNQRPDTAPDLRRAGNGG